MIEYTTHVELPSLEVAKIFEEDIRSAVKHTRVRENETGCWLSFTVDAEDEQDALFQLGAARLRLEMEGTKLPEEYGGGGADLFGTASLITTGPEGVIYSEWTMV